MITSVSWRNIWRNKLRSSIIIMAIALGVFAGVFSIAFMKGIADQRIDSAIMTEVSHIQIHHRGYLQTGDKDDYLARSDSILQTVKDRQGISSASRRMIFSSIISSAETGSGVKILGILPGDEQKVTDLHEKIIQGNYFDNAIRNPIVIGKELAEKLNVKLRSKVVITLTEMNGTLTGGAFKVAGIFETSNSMYDESHVFVRLEDLSGLVKLDEPAAHEIAILLDSHEAAKRQAKELQAQFPGLDVKPWTKLHPELAYLNESMGIYMYLFIAIILLALGFGIVNTMLMVVLERVRELGMLMSIGMNKPRVFAMILLETVYLSLTGGVLGIGVGSLLPGLTARTGINLGRWAAGFEAVGYESIVYPDIGFGMILVVTLLVILTGVLASLYPAFKALRLNPANALRTG